MPKVSTGDIQSHLNPIRIRIKGSGTMRTTVFNLGEASTDSVLLANTTLSATTSKSANVLCNFRAEKIAIDIRTLLISEWFEVSNIWAYVKPTANSYPQP